jgi:hypothetical protein
MSQSRGSGIPSRRYDRLVSRIAWGLAALVSGVIVGCAPAVWSVDIHRQATVVFGTECLEARTNSGGRCYAQVPAGGWPIPFLYEDSSMSPLGTLDWLDDFRLGWFLVDAAIFGALPIVGVAFLRRRWRRSAVFPGR